MNASLHKPSLSFIDYEQYILHDKTSISRLKTAVDIMKDIIMPYNVFNIGSI